MRRGAVSRTREWTGRDGRPFIDGAIEAGVVLVLNELGKRGEEGGGCFGVVHV